VNGSRTIHVVKRDGCVEAFDGPKLAGAMFRALADLEGTHRDARELSRAIEIFLQQRRWEYVSAAAVFEMAVKVLRRVRLGTAAEAMERHRAWRARAREQVRVHHDAGAVTLWDKSWVCEWARRVWRMSVPAARVLAAELEEYLLPHAPVDLDRSDLAEMVDQQAAAFGLVDAVPVQSPAWQRVGGDEPAPAT